MRQRIINLLKYNKKIYSIYYYFMNLCLNVLGLFISVDEKLILFNSFAGRKYDDSPKEIYISMLKDSRFKDCKFVWAFHNPDLFEVKGAEKIKTDTFQYFITAMKARVWITNSSVERGLQFKKKHTLYFNTWHGTPIKLMGNDIAKDNQSFKLKGKNNIDVMNSQGKYETDIFSRSFGIPIEKFLECGLPRNDELVECSQEKKQKIKEKIGLPENKKIILYCPTFREYERDEKTGCVLAPPININKWQEELGKDFILLFRAHYEVAKVMNIKENDFVRDMTAYPALNELMIVSDILISDYSSVYFDYSIMNKCMLHFTYDYDAYSEQRGMYFDIRKYISGGKTEQEVISILKTLDEDEELGKTKAFREKYVNFYGNATKCSVDYIAKHLNE